MVQTTGISKMNINGGDVAYEILGDPGSPAMVLTPGGRFTMDVPGLRPLAEKLVEGGMRVLLWDRPNSGQSEVQFYGASESHMRAETLGILIRELGLDPCVIAGGSGGARDSMLTVMLNENIATKLILWNIVGGTYSTLTLAGVYVLPNIHALSFAGLQGMIDLPEWQALIKTNPANLDRIKAFSESEMRTQLLDWLDAFVPKPGQTIPGVQDSMFRKITVPTLIVRGGEDDIDHPKRTSLEVHSLIKGSKIIEPPWPEDAWEQGVRAMAAGTGNIFDSWPLAAPAFLEFIKS